MEARAIFTNGLLSAGGKAFDATRCTPPGKLPQPNNNRLLQASSNAVAARRMPIWQYEATLLFRLERKVKFSLLGIASAMVWVAPVYAALDVGDAAPDFTTSASLAGKPYRFSLAEQLAKGPVVLYFFPAAFSTGCSIEAHEFAEATSKFEALGATVIGVSGDDVETLNKFSVQACQGKFAVASDESKTIIKQYDAVMPSRPDYANRISYVIAPGGTIVYNYMSLNPTRHAEKTLAAVRDWAKVARPK